MCHTPIGFPGRWATPCRMHCAFVSDCASSARQRLSIKLMAACAHPLANASMVLSAKSKTAPPSGGKRVDTPPKAERIKSGEGAIRHGGETYPVKMGQSVFLPAGLGDYALTGRMKLLRTRV